MSFYESGMTSIRSAAIKEAALAGHKYLVGQLYDECCTGAVSKSSYVGCADLDGAIAAAVQMTADVDWSATEWWDDADASVEYGDPACDRAMRELLKYRSITVGDYRVEIVEIA